MAPAAQKPRLWHSRQHQHGGIGCSSRPLRALRRLHVNARASAAAGAAPPQAELSPPQALLLQHVMNYQYTLDIPEGQLVISPLRQQWLQRSADLLADTFVDAKGIQPYRRYVRRNIGKYLEQHISMPPAAVLVTAVLRRPVEGISTGPDLGLHDLPSSAATTEQAPASSSSGGGAQRGDNPLGQLVLNCFGWLVKPETPYTTAAAAAAAAAATGTAGGSGSSSAAAGGVAAVADATDAGSSSSSSGGSVADAYAAVSIAAGSDSSTSHGMNSSAGQQHHNTSGGHNSSALGIVSSALQRLSDSVTLPQLLPQGGKGREQQVVETLVGIAEVSFNERTRSQALTLNPPQRCAYLCNMAVAKVWQRKGIASALVTAVEDLCLLAGESDLYLHLRFKDAATAGALYRKHGFTPAAKDFWLIQLVGQEPRFLMLKQLLASRTLLGQVLLPGFKQGLTAAELQQQVEKQQQGEQQVEPEGAAMQQQPAPAASPAVL